MNSILEAGKNLGISHNLSINVLDQRTGKILHSHEGHNCATNSMLLGIAHYLSGDGVLNQGYEMLKNYVPRYISLGTMGLFNQDEDASGLPEGIGDGEGAEEIRFAEYMRHVPGYGADGYDPNENNGREYLGLGPTFENRPDPSHTVKCELISESFPRSLISYRDTLPESQSELPETIDVVFSTMISTGALKQFREDGKDYVFISEVGMWSRKTWVDSGDNGLLAAYRIVPPNISDWDMTVEANRQLLKRNILRVGVNQVVQVIWKIQIGSISQLAGLPEEDGDNIYYPLDT